MAIALLLAAILLPVILFHQLDRRLRRSRKLAAAAAIALGWALNLAWAWAANESLGIAARFGWVCPTVLVAGTWLVLRYRKPRAS